MARLKFGLRIFVVSTFLVVLLQTRAESTPTAGPEDLSLTDFVNRVLERNENLQVRFLELQIAGKRYKSETGVFEPELQLGYDRVSNERENTAEQRRSSGVAVFEEDNDIYTSGIEGLVPTGAKIRLGYTLRKLRNNLQDPPLGVIYTNQPGAEYQSFAGINLTQPLLKNAWFSSTMANIRLAGLSEEVAFQEYRRQLMIVITTAEASYWNLFLAGEQVRFFKDSVKVAEALAEDNAARLQAGRGSELEVLEAKAGVALRRTKLAEAEQKYFEAAAQIAGLMSEVVKEPAPVLRANDVPKVNVAPDLEDSAEVALGMNPDYLAQTKKLEQEDIRLAYSKNQRLPQLDLRGSYGLNGLGSDIGSSWDDIQTGGFPSWSVGVELNIPLAGGIKGRNDLAAAQLRKRQALLLLKDVETQMLNSIMTAVKRLRAARSSVEDYEQIAAYNQNLLDSELSRLAAGKVDSRRVLEVDAALFESKVAVVEAKVQSERARLELELVQGSALQKRAMELSRKELEERTIRRLQDAGVSPAASRQFLDDAAVARRSGQSAVNRVPPRSSASGAGPGSP